MKEVQDFTSWWEKNKDRYEKIGVNEIVAKSIWDSACDCVASILKPLILKTNQ